jgi:tRNA(fMet)-specific endonuclease VapC
MRLLVDSNRFIDFCAGDEEAVERFESASLLGIPFIVMAEIRAGALIARRGQAQVRVLTELMNQPGVRGVHSSDSTTHLYAALYAQLRKAGTPIPTNDLWIAALALEHDFVLCTRDAHFDAIPQLPKIL